MALFKDYTSDNELEFIARCGAFFAGLGSGLAIFYPDKEKFRIVNPRKSSRLQVENCLEIQKFRGQYYLGSGLGYKGGQIIYALEFLSATVVSVNFFQRYVIIKNEPTNIKKPLNIPRNIYYFRYQFRVSDRYNQESKKQFITQVTQWAESFTGHALTLNLNSKKIRREQSGLPFSILRLGEGASAKYVAISNMQAGQAGAFGRVKVVYPMTIDGDILTVHLDKPEALKILVASETFINDEKLARPTAGAVEYFGKTHPEFGQQYRESKSQKHETRTLEHVQQCVAKLKEENYINANKKYYTMPLYPGIDGFDFFVTQNIVKYILKDNPNNTHYCLLSLFVKFAEALKFFHDQQLVHCDIKDDNFLIHWPIGTSVDDAVVHLIDLEALAIEGGVYRRSYNERYQTEALRSSSKVTVFRHQDIYSLGKMMGYMLKRLSLVQILQQFDEDMIKFINCMTNSVPDNRPDIDLVIFTLKQRQEHYRQYKIDPQPQPQPEPQPIPFEASPVSFCIRRVGA